MAANDAAQNVDRGFSESELADIMSEIDTLESQFADGSGDKKTADNILEGLFDAEEPKAAPKETPKAAPKLVVKDPLDEIQELTHDKLNVDNDIMEVTTALETKTVKQPSVKESSKLNIHGVDDIKPRVIKNPIPSKIENGFTQLNFKIKHDTKMQINFSLDDQVFSVLVDAENNLTMELGGGIEFSFPLQFKK